MANSSTIITLSEQALQNSDAGALDVDQFAPDLWQPAILLSSSQSGATFAGTNLDGNGQRWRVLCAPRAAYPGYVFMCISLRCTMHMPSVAASDTFWETSFAYSIEGGCDSNAGLWQQGTGPDTYNYFDGTSVSRIQAFSPELRGYPPRPFRPGSDSAAENSLGGFQFEVQTYDATVKASGTLTVDARFLGWPQAVTRSAGLYVPRMYAKLN